MPQLVGARRRILPLPKGLPLPTSPPAVSQSQRDCVLQPRVASSELPWVNWTRRRQPQRGCGLQSSLEAATPLGLDAFWTPFSQGGSLLATLGFETESLWDSSARRCDLWGMLSLWGEGWGEGECGARRERGSAQSHAAPISGSGSGVLCLLTDRPGDSCGR